MSDSDVCVCSRLIIRRRGDGQRIRHRTVADDPRAPWCEGGAQTYAKTGRKKRSVDYPALQTALQTLALEAKRSMDNTQVGEMPTRALTPAWRRVATLMRP